MEILKRAKSGGETVAWNESESNVREEVEKRNRRAGYLRGKSKIMIAPPTRKYEENYRRIFGHD
jgi:hypothetical protein